MKALVAHTYGPVEDLVFTDVPKPVPGPGQILVRTEAVAINAADTVLITGVMKEVFPLEHPFVPGIDISGVVEEVGEGVTRFAEGDTVLAWLGLPSGAMAEYVLIDEAPSVAKRPAGLDAIEGAALPTGGLTAFAAVEAAELGPDRTVLIVGAAGGVGSFAVQFAKQTGARVLASGWGEDADYLKRLGADETIDYRSVDVPEETLRLVPGGVDAVIDLAHAGPDLTESVAATKSGGRVVFVLGSPPESLDRGVTAVYAGAGAPEGRLDDLAAQAAKGRLHIQVSADYPFSRAPEAIAAFSRHHLRGKSTVTF